MRKWFARVHRIAGLAAGSILVVISLSGSLLVFRQAIERRLDPELHVVTPGPHRAPLDAVRETARIALDPLAVRTIGLPRDGVSSIHVRPADPEAPHAFIDPYTGKLLGLQRETGGAMGFVFQLHTHLLAGEAGEWVIGGTGLTLLVMSLTGLVLAWPGRRKLRLAVTIAWSRPKRRMYDLHRAAGTWTGAFLLLAGLTGSALVFNEGATALLRIVTHSRPDPPLPRSTSVPGARDVSVDTAVASARGIFSEGEITFVTLPVKPADALVVRLRQPGELHPNGRTFVYFDRYTGRVLHVRDAHRESRAVRLYNLAYPIHIGTWAGPLRVVYVVLGLMPALLTITGVLLWWRKRKVGRSGRGEVRPYDSRRFARSQAS